MKITAASHLDHNLGGAHLAFLMKLFADRAAFFIETITLPDELRAVPCGLHGPVMGDPPVVEGTCMVTRDGREWPSRVVDRPQRMTRQLTVIAGPHEGDACVLYTAYGGPQAPREPGDTSLVAGSEEAKASAAFWAEHALTMVRSQRAE